MKCTFTHDELQNLTTALGNEFLLTNGRGGYASSTILGCHTRKYHGLLNLPIKGQGDPSSLLSKFDVSVVMGEKEFRLSTNKFPYVYFPMGYQFIDSFTMEDYPITRFRFGDVCIEESMLMPYGEEAILVRYDITEGDKAVVLKIIPFLSYRNIHSLGHENLFLRPRTCKETLGFSIAPYGKMPVLSITTSINSEFFPSPTWWHHFEYNEEQRRGYDYHEDLFAPGIFEITLKARDSVILLATINEKTLSANDIPVLWENEITRIQKAKKNNAKKSQSLTDLISQASHYLVTYRNNEKGIIAGYPWFREWGRDSMISLTGLTLCRNDFETARNILVKYTRNIKDGLMPNIISEDGHHSYNAIDTSLFFFWASGKYCEYSEDYEFVRNSLLPTMKDIIGNYFNRCSDEGFIFCGDETTNMTWMDACAFGCPVTQRNGAPVEINALWYNALAFLYTNFNKDLGDSLKRKIEETIELLRKYFPVRFWNSDHESLYDVYRQDGKSDRAIRPNQLFAIGLPYTCIEQDKAEKILSTVQKHLVTPYGLRTLSPEDEHYRNTYEGDENNRSLSYHQGMIWPWLIGIYTDALLKVFPKKNIQKYIHDTFSNLWKEHLGTCGLFHISEIFTPDPPYVPKGTIAQAWNVAEVIRTLEVISKM